MATAATTHGYTRFFFVDINAFASVEQQDNLRLRGKPVAVCPVLADSTCAISVSYEAKKWGIKTGTGIKKAKLLCPHLEVVLARPSRYVEVSKLIVQCLNNHFVYIHPLYIDEMVCVYGRQYEGIEKEIELARRVKADLAKTIGSYMKCSVGMAPNIFLAKVACEMQKPDGLTIFPNDNYQEQLFELELTDLPGIASGIEARLNRRGIRTVKDLWEASSTELHTAWGSRVGVHWWYMLRGDIKLDYVAIMLPETKQTVGHSHVLPPDLKSIDGA